MSVNPTKLVGDKIYECSYCNHTSKWKQNIKKHEKTQHEKTQNGKEEIVQEDNEKPKN